MGRNSLMYRYLSLDLTSHCNLRCWFCGKQYGDMQRGHMTTEQLRAIIRYVAPRIDGDTVRVSGGEPLMHPAFNDMMFTLLYVPFRRIEVATNGLLLDAVDPDLYRFTTFLVSVYPGVNDHIVQASDALYYVKLIHPAIIDPTTDPNLSDAESQWAYNHCVYHMAKVVGDKVYGCCHAETMERVHGGEYGVQVGPGWEGELARVEKWRACAHCFIARSNDESPS